MANNSAFDAWTTDQLQRVEQALQGWVGEGAPDGLREAMRYAVLDGGKRLRPLLVLAASEAVQGLAEGALRGACAIELIHAYSLVHDDMPCMDNDVLRRGKPTVHVQFGESAALLAGDSLQTQAFELLTPAADLVPAAMQADQCRILARASGGQGMAGGQAIDLASVGLQLTQDELQHMHALKTGALLQASVMLGVATGQCSAEAAQQLQQYASAIGLAFQVVDDILDVTADSQTLGKTAGKDAANDKPTYVSLMGLDASRQYAQQLHQQAQAALAASGLAETDKLHAIADWVINRAY
ncbi:polyprenyl synthetase family protein [Brachymonas sp. G34]|nr:farnesyl diphosphate synthase [Brachymonas sp. J145]MEE1654236.1 farnesyl diphosphate synthase [Brachymonas sp. J145]